MPGYRKLGRATDQRLAILKNLVTVFLQKGRIETTEARAKEVKKIAENVITLAVREVDNFTSKQVKVSAAKLDSKGRKITKSATSKNGRVYEVVDREIKTEMVQVDSPSRLHARKQITRWLNRPCDEKGSRINVANIVFADIAPKYKARNLEGKGESGSKGGYTRIYKLGPRRGDAAEMVILELV